MSGAGWDCVRDATTLRGLAALRRERPRDWHRVMRGAARRVGLGATVGEALRAGGQGRLLPDDPSPAAANRLKAARSAARWLVGWCGAVRLGAVTEAWLQRERRRQAKAAEVSRDQVGRAFTLLRKLALRAARQDRVPARVRPRCTRGRRAPVAEPPPRPAVDWGTVEALMSDAQDLRVRCAVTLQAHVGASPGRVLALRVGDVDVRRGVVWVGVPGLDEQVVREPYALPADAAQAVLPWLLRRAGRGGDSALLFPQRGDARRPTRSISRALRRAAEQFGGEPVTLQEVRRLAQGCLRRMGGTRAQVRGSRRVRPRRSPESGRRLDRQRRSWRALPAGGRRLALRAPRRCGADEPELRRRGRRGAWRASTPVVRTGGGAGGQAVGVAVQSSESETPAEAAITEMVTGPGWRPGPVLAVPPAFTVPKVVVEHRTVHVHGASQAEVDAVAQQAFATGVAVPGLIRWWQNRGR